MSPETSNSVAVPTTVTSSTLATTTLLTQIPPAAQACGVERWAVKTGMDPAAATINQSTVVPTSIAALSALVAPAAPTARVAPTETTVFSIHATIVKYKIELGDSDYHVVLADAQGQTMITEIPSPDCITASPFKAAIGDVRAAFFTRFHPGPSFRSTRTEVTVTGVGFFDRIHGQTGVARNGVELHPVLAITFG